MCDKMHKHLFFLSLFLKRLKTFYQSVTVSVVTPCHVWCLRQPVLKTVFLHTKWKNIHNNLPKLNEGTLSLKDSICQPAWTDWPPSINASSDGPAVTGNISSGLTMAWNLRPKTSLTQQTGRRALNSWKHRITLFLFLSMFIAYILRCFCFV